MYNNESYEEYIRSILGYPNYSNNHFENNNYYPNDCDYRNTQGNNDEIEACYPEIYKIIYPMITKACNNNTIPITSELIDELTDEIYNSVQPPENEIQLNINLTNNVTTNKTINNRNVPNSQLKRETTSEKREEENRQFRNNSFRDLIKILLIRELLGNNRPNRPGNRPPVIRPPFPGGPGGMMDPGQGPRPPIMPRNNYFN